MSAVGLTAAMRKALENPGHADTCWKRAVAAGFLRNARIHYAGFGWGEGLELTPRGHAALAAPRMTQAELGLMERIEVSAYAALELGYSALHCKGWVSEGALTPSGLKALNDVRAATGSELYKDNM